MLELGIMVEDKQTKFKGKIVGMSLYSHSPWSAQVKNENGEIRHFLIETLVEAKEVSVTEYRPRDKK